MEENILKKQKLTSLWNSNEELYTILKNSKNLEETRRKIYDYLNGEEKDIFYNTKNKHRLENINSRKCINILRNIISPFNEKRTQESALRDLRNLARSENGRFLRKISLGFIQEFIYLFKGIKGESGLYSFSGGDDFLSKKGQESANIRSEHLDRLAEYANYFMDRYPAGLDPKIKSKRERNKQRIMSFFDATEDDWRDWRWQLKNVIRNAETLKKLINLTQKETKAIELAEKSGMPFGITPYYVSLMDKASHRRYDHAVRAQVIPPYEYVKLYSEHKRSFKITADFMAERDTSPVKLVTRRYPEIAILKPYNTCFQICVYCQRNWEITDVLDVKAKPGKKQIEKAIQWFENHMEVIEILITGGDPFVLRNKDLIYLLDRISGIKHIQRIRFGTRAPVVLPFRFTEEVMEILASYHVPGKREIIVVTHIEHPYEVTDDLVAAVKRIKRKGISVYNQMVFTIENSRKFEAAALRRLLRVVGIDPYYTFVTKSKKEISRYKVPLARVLQERKEEARIMGGMARTDEAVYNIPRIGKNHVTSWQHHEVVMINPKGERYYEFHPWEKYISPVNTYIDKDVPIYEFLQELKERGENLSDYKTIWYYY